MNGKGKLKPKGITLGKSKLDMTDFPDFYIKAPIKEKKTKINIINKRKNNKKEELF